MKQAIDMVGDRIGRFLREYERNNNAGDMDAVVGQFADVFMIADPHGVRTVRASDFAVALPRRKKLFDEIGCRSAELVAMTEMRLDSRYGMAETQWRMVFSRSDGREEVLLVNSTFLVDTGGDAMKIVLYMPHQDIMGILRERGLLVD
jgi:hypothetical protein